jgi:hypothetical protein
VQDVVKEKSKRTDIRKIQEIGRPYLRKLRFFCFLMGTIIAVISGLALGFNPDIQSEDTWGYIATMLALLGLQIGIVNLLAYKVIPVENINKFLVATVALVILGVGTQALEVIPLIGPCIAGIALSMLLMFAPAAVLLALRVRWDQIIVFKREKPG